MVNKIIKGMIVGGCTLYLKVPKKEILDKMNLPPRAHLFKVTFEGRKIIFELYKSLRSGKKK